MKKTKTVRLFALPPHLWTVIAFLSGLFLGGVFPTYLNSIAAGTQRALHGFIALVPILIIFALSPAICKLASLGKGAKLGGGVVGWYMLTSSVAGLLGLLASSVLFDIQISTIGEDSVNSALQMFAALKNSSGASGPLIAIVVAVILGMVGSKVERVNSTLLAMDRLMERSSPALVRIMPFVVFFLGIALGISIGATESLKYYAFMTLYTASLCFIWWAVYVFIILRFFAPQPFLRLMKSYYIPTAVFAAGTCSSIATMPINLLNVKKFGVGGPVANFVIPIGAVLNMDMSAMAYVAYAPFIMTVVFDLPVSWAVLLIAWPAVVVFTIAAPGLPAGMGTALWSSTLFASLLGLTGDQKTSFITTWIALSGGIPDMLRTATNCTSDGFTAMVFDRPNSSFSAEKASEPEL